MRILLVEDSKPIRRERLSSLSEKNREKLLKAGADEYLEKNLLRPEKGVKLLPREVLEKVISRRRHIAFLRVPASH